jgi:hypothetical protein
MQGGGDKNGIVVPDYVQFSEDGEGDLRCSELTFDIHASFGVSYWKKQAGVGSDNDNKEEEENNNGKQCMEKDNKVQNIMSSATRKRATSDITNHASEGGEAESFAQWTSRGPLGYSVTSSHLDGGGIDDAKQQAMNMNTATRVEQQQVVGDKGNPHHPSKSPQQSTTQQPQVDSEDEHWTPSEFAFSSVET